MFSGKLINTFRSFAFYLGMGYLIVYVLCAACLYFISSHIITDSVRTHDRQDVIAESEELIELLKQNPNGNMLAEHVTMGRYPPLTIFIMRIINAKHEVVYTISWPGKIDFSDFPVLTQEALAPGTVRRNEYYIKPLRRYIQVLTTPLEDGRILQVGKGSVLERDQKRMMRHMLLVFVALATLFSLVSTIFLLLITLRPINRIAASMDHIIKTGAFENNAPPVKSLIRELDRLGQLFTIMTTKYASLIQAMRQTMDNVAHDFRTPLTRIRGASELALSKQALPENVAETLADIIEDCDRAKLQLQNLMDAREMESGFVQLNHQPLDLALLIREICDLYSLVAEEKQIALCLELPPTALIIAGDRQRLARVCANLVDNAIKYTPKHGRVNVSLQEQPTIAIITVTDTGIGIPATEISLIGQRLYRGERARACEKGLGLGLNIVKIIIAAHGGTLTITSEPQQGAVFCVTLPKEPQPPTLN